jgi:uncharacterized protein YodC (DUF2158 family)
MATKFKKGDEVKVRQINPSGPVLALRMDEDGNVYCLLKWTDVNGAEQERWFLEDDLTAV